MKKNTKNTKFTKKVKSQSLEDDFQPSQSQQEADDWMSQQEVQANRKKKESKTSYFKGSLKNSKKSINSSKNHFDESSEEVIQKQRKPKKILKKESINSDSNNSQILEIRNDDETTRDYVRPAFLSRWDGSNQVEIMTNEFKDMTPMMRVYWQVKCKNMNSVVFLEFGKMECFAFQNDAILLNQMFKKKIKKFCRFLMVNFWCKQIQKAKEQLFNRKIPVLVMNQIEDPEYKLKHKLIKRQIRQVLTPGIHFNMVDTTFKERLILSIIKIGKRCGVCVLDCEANHIYVEEISDDKHHHEIRRIINRYRPVQLIIPKNNKEIVHIAKQICNPYVVELNFTYKTLNSTIQKFRQTNPSTTLFMEILSNYLKEEPQSDQQFSMFSIVQVFCLLKQYLESLSLFQKIFQQCMFRMQKLLKLKTKPFFDSQVYENLQIFRIKNEAQSYSKPGTLINFMDKCKTTQGKKLLHRWLDEPLQDLQSILVRQQAIQELVEKKPILFQLHQKLMAYQRMEGRVADVYHWVIRSSEKGKLILTKSINFDKEYKQNKNPAIVKLKEIVNILTQFLEYQNLLSEFLSHKVKSSFLKNILKVIKVKKLQKLSDQKIQALQGLPDLKEIIYNKFLKKFTIDELRDELEPKQGVSKQFDHQKLAIEELNKQLYAELDGWKEFFLNNKLSFASVRAKNEIQVPKGAITATIKSNKKYKQLIYSSETAKQIRFTTPKTYQISQQLIEHEQILAESYEPFLQQIVSEFCSYRIFWDLYVQSMAKLDVMLSLGHVCKRMAIRCLPTFQEEGQGDEKEEVSIVDGYHVGLLQVMDDVVGNQLSFQGSQRLLLLTGPNMGGKSTILRQTCLLAIMAQIGMYVPAKHYKSIIFDQIFCRIGASDRIYEGKSTFYVELEQTKRILGQATKNSLIMIDQLGRGTSTYDGMAIAEAILDFIIDEIGAYTLFSTHYTQITQRYKKCAEVKLMKMAYSIGQAGLQFNYQLQEGVAEKSFANNVAELVRINNSIIKKSQQKAEQMRIDNQKKKRQFCDKMYRAFKWAKKEDQKMDIEEKDNTKESLIASSGKKSRKMVID